MKKLKNMMKAIRETGIQSLLISYLIMIFICAVCLVIIEPEFHTLLDGLWYSVVTITTVGFGDLVAVTTVGKIISMILMLSGVLIVALLTGTLVNYYVTINNARKNESLVKFLDELEKLPELSKEELEQLSKKIKESRLSR